MIKLSLWLITTLRAASINVDGQEIEEGKGATLKCQPSNDAQSGRIYYFLQIYDSRLVYWSYTNPIEGDQQTIFAMDSNSNGVKVVFAWKS